MFFGGCSRLNFLNFGCSQFPCENDDSEVVVKKCEDHELHVFAPVISEPEAEPQRLALPACAENIETEYDVALDRRDGARLGIDVDHRDGVTLLVEQLTGGLVGAWNKDNPNACIEEGDCVLAVNGVQGDAARLVEECRKSEILKLTLRRRAYCTPFDDDPPVRERTGGSSIPHEGPVSMASMSTLEGYQRLTYGDGSTYAGQIVAGRRHGHGLWHNWTGQYDGEWEADMQHGAGRQTWSDGRSYNGQFRAGQFAGHGQMVWHTAKGRLIYEGSYYDDLKHGSGKFVWGDGRSYEGEWQRGKRHGCGVYVNASGQPRSGFWTDGRFERWETEEVTTGTENHEYSNNYDFN